MHIEGKTKKTKKKKKINNTKQEKPKNKKNINDKRYKYNAKYVISYRLKQIFHGPLSFFVFIVNYIIVNFDDLLLSKVSSAAPRDLRE